MSHFDSNLEKALKELNTKEDFKNYFKKEIIEHEDPYELCYFVNEGVIYGAGVRAVYRYLVDEKSEKLAALTEAAVECFLDSDLFYTVSFVNQNKKIFYFGEELRMYLNLCYPVKNFELAKKVKQRIMFEDITTGKINKESSNYLQQFCLAELCFSLSDDSDCKRLLESFGGAE